MEQQLAFVHGPIIDHVEVLDLEVLSDVACHPDVVNPEEFDLGGGFDDGGGSARGGDVDPAGAVRGIEFGLHCWVPGNVFVGGEPLAAGVSLKEKSV